MGSAWGNLLDVLRMSNADAIAALKSKLHSSLDQVNLPLYNGNNAPINFNFGACADNLTDLLWKFYVTNGRFPNVIFNDGVPPSAAVELKSKPFFDSPFYYESLFDPNYGENVGTIPAPSIKIKLNGKVWTNHTVTYELESGTVTEYDNLTLPPQWLNTRSYSIPTQPAYQQTIPLDLIDFGAYQTWAILLVIYSRPDFCFATDDGVMLYPDGISMLENSMKYFLFQKSSGSIAGNVLTIQSVAGNGPFLVGFPDAIIQKIYDDFIKIRNSGSGWTPFIIEMIKVIVSAVGLYFGASALSGIVGGNFAIANLTSTVNLAKQMGVDTGQASAALKIIDLTGVTSLSTIAANAGSSSVDYVDFPIPESFSDLSFDDQYWLDMGALDIAMADFQPIADMVVDPSFDLTSYADSTTAFNASPIFDSFATPLPDNAWGFDLVGPLSTNQYAAAAGAAPSVAAAASDAMNSAGAGNSINPTYDQINTAATNAANNAVSFANAGNSILSSVWATASKVLTLYMQYQQIVMKKPLPTGISYPTAVGQPVRQPDGSVSILNADGTISTIRPNGAVLNSSPGSTLPSILSGNMPLYIGGGLVLLALVLSKRGE